MLFFFLPLLLVRVDRSIATSSLLVYVDWFAVVCKVCGGDPERTRESGATARFTAAGCNAKYGREDDDGCLRFSQWFRGPVAAMVPKLSMFS